MSHLHLNRRRLLKAASGTAALGLLRSVMPVGRVAWADDALDRVLLSALFEQYGAAQVKALALQALDIAKSRGAQFADVRIVLSRYLSLRCYAKGTNRVLNDNAAIGIRVVVDGAWGFAGGDGLGTEHVANLAGLAIERAKAGRAPRPKALEIAPAPFINYASWETPIEIDPFTVPIREQEELMLEAIRYASQAKSSSAIIKNVLANASWITSRRVFASSEGSFISQRLHSALPGADATVAPADEHTRSIQVPADVRALRVGGVGYEAVSKSNLKEELRKAVEEGLRLAALPARSVDVGRYDLVLSPELMASVLIKTVGSALALDRARGDYADGVGTSYAMPPAEVLGRYQLGSKLLNVTADRSRPGAGMTVGWDEEGVQPDNFTLVKDGVIADFITTRPTAPTIASWYASQGKPLRSHGCATRSGSWPPSLQLPNLTIQPGSDTADVAELIRDIKKGFYVVNGNGSVDQQCLNAQYAGFQVHEIRNGKLIGLARDLAFQFNTPQFWKSLHALGGAASATLCHHAVDGADINFSHVGVQSVPARFRQVNVVNTGKQA